MLHVNVLSKYFNRWVQTEIDGKIVKKIYNLHNLGKLISYEEKEVTVRIPAYDKMNGIIERCFGNYFTTDTKFRFRNIISKIALLFGGENLGHIKERRPNNGSGTNEIFNTAVGIQKYWIAQRTLPSETD